LEFGDKLSLIYCRNKFDRASLIIVILRRQLPMGSNRGHSGGAGTVPSLLASRALSDPDKIAITVDGVGDLSFSLWQQRSSALACGLSESGLRPGDRVGLQYGGRGWIEFAIVYCAVQMAGGTAIPLSDRTPLAELAFMLANCCAVGLIHQSGHDPQWTAGWTATIDDITAPDPDPEFADLSSSDGLAQVLYTSGTTARPKGVAASHANLTYGADAPRRPFLHSRHLVHAFPIGTNAGQVMLMNALTAHPTVVTLPAFTPVRFARVIQDYAAGTVFVVPAMAIELLNSGAAEHYDLSSVRLLGSAAAPLPAPIAARLSVAFPKAAIANYYTSTEAAPAQTVMMFDSDRPGSVGQAIAGGGVRIADPDGRDCAPGETGEVWMRSPTQTRSYLGDVAATGAVFRRGWIRMGDLGYLDGDGYLYLVDRESDVIKSGAYKISALQVESAVYEHPAVLDAAVVGIPHPVLGAQLTVAVVLRSPLSPEDLRTFLSSRLAPHEIPHRVVPIESLPRNRGGKVDKRSLQRTLA
jgi:acyl-CoA synthetase (AMP-forming)/AMP-acid ligase II